MNNKKKNRIIYVAPALSSFVRNDISILSKKYEVTVNIYNWKNKILTPVYMLIQFFSILRYSSTTKAIIVSFGGYWALSPVLAGKLTGIPSYVILNGTDAASFPSINYGNLRKFFLRFVIKRSLKLATLLLPVSSSLAFTKNTFYLEEGESGTIQGFKHFFPDIKTPYKVLHNGIDENLWKPSGQIKKEKNSFLSVFSGNQQMFLKGGDMIMRMAEIFPDFNFYLVGLSKPSGLKNKNNNLFFIENLAPEELKKYYNKSRFYLQLSIFEGFGMALCEAMLCECVPIGSAVNIIPEIIGDTGFILEKREDELLEQLLTKAASTENLDELGKKARERIIEKFSLKKREVELLSLIENQVIN